MVKENTRILVVDDEQGYCEVLKTILTGKGYAVETCNNGKEALTVLEKSSFRYSYFRPEDASHGWIRAS